MQIALALFDRFTALDAVGPYEVLGRVPGAEVVVVADRPGPVRTDLGSLGLVADAAFEDVRRPDVVVVPGGPGTRAHLDGTSSLSAWVRSTRATARWTTSVCTGALVLAGAGLLAGRTATTHWASADLLESLGARYAAERVVVDGDLVTAAGVSAGIDMALTLAAAIAGDDVARAIQLGIEYDPHPPFDAGTPAKAGPELTALVRALGPDGDGS